jgi:hypothetical protein
MKRKTSIVLILALIICMGFSGLVLADNPIRLFVNGSEIYPDVPPQIINNRTMVPLRAVAEALNCEVAWDSGRVDINTVPNIELEISGPDDFRVLINESINRMDNETRNVVLKYTKRIVFEDPPTFILPQYYASMDYFYSCHINGPKYYKLKSEQPPDDLVLLYLAYLSHESMHSVLYHAGATETYTQKDQEAVCDLFVLRALKKTGISETHPVYKAFKTSFDKELKL